MLGSVCVQVPWIGVMSFGFGVFTRLFKQPHALAWLVGCLCGQLHLSPAPDLKERLKGVMVGSVDHLPEPTPKGAKYILRVNQIGSHPLSRDLLVQIHQSVEPFPNKGDQLRVQGVFHRPRNLGNAGEFDFENHARCRKVSYVGSLRQKENITVLAQNQSAFWTLVAHTQQSFREQLEHYLSAQNQALVRALIFGEGTWLEPKVREVFRKTGLLHVLVVSGAHLWMVAGWGMLLLRLLSSFWRFKKVQLWTLEAFAMLLGVGLYRSFVCPSFPVERAWGVVLIVSLFILLKRKVYGQQVAVFLLGGYVVFQPFWLSDLSFLLSFASGLGILQFEKTKEKQNHRITLLEKTKLFLLDQCKVSFGAFLWTTPLIWFFFQRVSVWALGANVLLVPWFGGVLLLCLISFLSFKVCPALSHYLLCCVDEMLNGLFFISQTISNWPGSNVWVQKEMVLGVFCVSAFVFLWLKKRTAQNLVLQGVLIFLSGVFLFKCLEPFSPQIHFLSVGQGDSALVRLKKDQTMLIDAGGGVFGFEAGSKILAPYLSYQGIDTLDVLVLTHGDMDHIGGAFELFDHVTIKNIWVPIGNEGQNLKRVLDKAREKKIPIFYVHDQMNFKDFKDIHILHPSLARTFQSSNNQSLVLKVPLGSVRALFTGDIEKEAEVFLSMQPEKLKSQVLKVAHHGSQTSSHNVFLKHTQALFGVMGVGYLNPYHHPSPKAMQRLRQNGIKVLRTDLCGEVKLKIKTDGYYFQTHKKC